MTRLAWASLRSRMGAFTAAFVSIALAAGLIGSFASLAQDGLASGVGHDDRQTLLIMGGVVGGWGAMIALFSLVSTVGVVVRQREVEIGLLRTVGTTPRQARRMVRAEILLVAVAAGVVGSAIAAVGGAVLLAVLRGSGVVNDSVERSGGVLALGGTTAVLVVLSMLAAGVAGRRATRGSASTVLSGAAVEGGKLPKWRLVVGLLLVVYGSGMGLVTLVAMRHPKDPYAPMQTCGSAAIVVGLGLAALSPALLRGATGVLRPLLELGGSAGHLAAFNTARRSRLLSGVLGPVIVLTATAVSTLMAVGIDGRRLDALVTDRQEEKAVTLLNYVVTGMIAVFAAIMVLNALVAVIGQRRAEFQRLHLVGATSRQVRASVLVEAAVIAAVGIALGLVASVVTVLPYSVVRGEGVVPDGQLWLPVVLAAVAAALTIGGSALAVRRADAAASRLAVTGAAR